MGQRAGPGLRLRWLGHSTVVLDIDGVRILTDPLLRRHAGLLRRLGPAPEPGAWRDPDVVLVSHLHHDHAELASLRRVRGARVLSTARNATWLRTRGLPAEAHPHDRWTPVGGGVEVRPVRADHARRPLPHRPGDAVGHLVRGPAGVVWLAGDTGLYAEMAELPRLAGRRVDLAVIPVWGWGPRLSGGHLDPEQAARAVASAGAAHAVPVHWGTLHPPLVGGRGSAWLEEPGHRFAAALRASSPAQAVVLAPGGSWDLPDPG